MSKIDVQVALRPATVSRTVAECWRALTIAPVPAVTAR